MKKCSKCKEEKDENEFTFDIRASDGRQSSCRVCEKLRHNTPEAIQRRRDRRLLKKYGMTSRDYDTLLEEQKGKCANDACHVRHSDSAKLVVDHNHATGEVRGLLCSPCNVGLGNLQDSPKILQGALEYLKRTGYYGE